MKATVFFPYIIVSFFLLSCSVEHKNNGKTVFTYNESNGISSLDPAFARNLENMWAVNQLFDGLVELDEQLNIEPLIAHSWDIQDSGKTYVFHLNKGVFFHPSVAFGPDSTREVVASDFEYSFNRIIDPATASSGKWVFDLVDFNNNGGFESPDDSTFVIHLKQAFSPFLGMLAMQYCNVVPFEVVEFHGEDFRENPIGTGPFKMAFWMENVALVYHKNALFFQTDSAGMVLPYLDAVKIEFVRDMSAEFMGLIKGDYDFMSGIHPAYKDELLEPSGELSSAFAKDIRFQKTPFIKTDYIGLLVDQDIPLSADHPLHDARIRRALNHSVNRDQMVRFLRNNAVVSAEHGFVPKGLPSYDKNSNYGTPYDIEKAKELLADAGFPNGENIPVIELSTTSDYVDLCEFLQFEWKKIGVQVQIDVLAGSAHREKVSKSQALAFRKSWLADYPDAENFLGLFYSKNFCPGGPNYTHYYSSEFDSLFDLSRACDDQEIRRKMYRQMDSLIMKDSPVIPLFYDQVSHFISNDVLYFETNSVNMLDLKETKKF